MKLAVTTSKRLKVYRDHIENTIHTRFKYTAHKMIYHFFFFVLNALLHVQCAVVNLFIWFTKKKSSPVLFFSLSFRLQFNATLFLHHRHRHHHPTAAEKFRISTEKHCHIYDPITIKCIWNELPLKKKNNTFILRANNKQTNKLCFLFSVLFHFILRYLERFITTKGTTNVETNQRNNTNNK